LACGHGLLGVLFAYRFPKAKICCVDLELRDGFGHFCSVFEEFGQKEEGETKVLFNL
jgi:hypothetical protein